jgi:hypothetical protein
MCVEVAKVLKLVFDLMLVLFVCFGHVVFFFLQTMPFVVIVLKLCDTYILEII